MIAPGRRGPAVLAELRVAGRLEKIGVDGRGRRDEFLYE